MISDILNSVSNNETIIPVIGFEMLPVRQENGTLVPYLEHLSNHIATIEGFAINCTEKGFDYFNHCIHQLLRATDFDLVSTRKKISQYAIEIHDLVDTSYLEKIVSISPFNYFFNLTFTSHLGEVVTAKRTFPNISPKVSSFPHMMKKPKQPDDLIKNDCLYEGVVYNIFGLAYHKQKTFHDYYYSDDEILAFIPSFSRWYEIRLNNYKEVVTDASLLFLGCQYPDWLTRIMINTLKPNSLEINKVLARVFFDYCNDVSNSFFLDKHKFKYQGQTPTLQLINELSDLLSRNNFVLNIKNKDFVFVSYTQDNLALAQKVICQLSKSMNVWFDRIKMFPGDIINDEVKEGIQNCKLFLPLITANSVAKLPGDYVRQEWRYYSDNFSDSKKVIPLVFRNEVNLGTLGFDIDTEFGRPRSNIFYVLIDENGLTEPDILNIQTKMA
jgi:hypothetical protein